MSRTLLSLILSAAFALTLCACADDTNAPHKHPPQDPPDYKGVPTDMTPPSMITPASTPSTSQ